MSKFFEPDTSENIVVSIGYQFESATFCVHPVSAQKIKQQFPDAPALSFVCVGGTKGTGQVSLSNWPQIINLLVGVNLEQLLEKFPRVLLWSPEFGTLQERTADGLKRSAEK